mgnify:CR=1 FL=1
MKKYILLGQRIKKMRLELGLKQEELALKVGLSNKSSIATYESGRSSPSDDIKLKLCSVFGCSMDYLTGNDEAGTFAPDSNIRRMEVAAITGRMAVPSQRETVSLKNGEETEKKYNVCFASWTGLVT